ncbi:MAG: YdiU family protein, partial [Acidiferrobacterales bacterium]|nr:YdiU family protein [Acidiferrobacterales bacterium]
EYLVSEAMYALGIPTTRSLAAVTTGERVVRESPLPGAVLTRVASSHLRVGTFEFFAAKGETAKVKQLADYAIQRHFPELLTRQDRYLCFLEAVLDVQALLIAKWMSIGFIHGVMNTDNTTISGETIDYGPCAFMDYYHPATVFSSIDTHGRYAYQNQPSMAVWNLTRLAEALLPLIDTDEGKGVEKASAVLNTFSDKYFSDWLDCFRQKLGLMTERSEDRDIANGLLKIMEAERVDFTQLFRSLADAANGSPEILKSLFKHPDSIQEWLDQWLERLAREKVSEKMLRKHLAQTNPIYVPRNHMVEKALGAATDHQDFSLFEKLLDVLASPFTKRAGLEEYEQPAPDNGIPYQTFCGT